MLSANTETLSVNTKTLPSMPEFKVRTAIEADIPQLVALGRDLHYENGVMPFNEAKAYQIAGQAVRGDGVVCGCIGPVGKIEALIFLMLGCYWYSDQQHLEEIFLYVKPEFRRSTRAKTLIEYAKMCARTLKIPLIIGVLSPERTEAKRRLYERQLGKPAGYYFLYNGKTGR